MSFGTENVFNEYEQTTDIPVIANESLVTQETLFVPFLGQSNAYNLSQIYQPYQPGAIANDTSGGIILDQNLTNLTGQNIITSDRPANNFALGGSRANGNAENRDNKPNWWYPNENLPGEALLQAEVRLANWLSILGAQPTDEIAVVWSQGESDVANLRDGNPVARDKYKQSTIAIFDYLHSKLNYANVKFYLTPIGRFQPQGADNAGFSTREIEEVNQGVAIVRQVQAEIALERDDVQLTTDYVDLNMVYEEGVIYGDSYDQDEDEWSDDLWHLGHNGLKVHGDRLAQYIALDRGETNVISFTDSVGNPAESIALSRNGLLDLNVSANSNLGLIQGTQTSDLIVGTLTADEIAGSGGNDVIIASQGVDTVTGGTGNDVFFYDSLVYPEFELHLDRILDFEIGSDRLDISEPLRLLNYNGVSPIADGYVWGHVPNENSVEIKFDLDGIGVQPPINLAILENIDAFEFINQMPTQFIFTPTEF